MLDGPASDSSSRNAAIPCGVRSSAGESAKGRSIRCFGVMDVCVAVDDGDRLWAYGVPLILGRAVALGLIGMGEAECGVWDRAAGMGGSIRSLRSVMFFSSLSAFFLRRIAH